MVRAVSLAARLAAVLLLSTQAGVAGAQPSGPSTGNTPELPLECQPKAAAQQALSTAGQVPLLEARGANDSASRVVLSANADLTQGYVIEVKPAEVCLILLVSNIRLSPRQDRIIPAWAPLKGSRHQQFNGLLVEETLRTSGRVIFGGVLRDDSGFLAARLIAVAGGKGSFLLAAGYADGTFRIVASRPAMTMNSNFEALAARFDGDGASDLERLTGPSPHPERRIAALERACLLGEAELCGIYALAYNGRPAEGDDPGFPRDVARSVLFARVGCDLNDAQSCLQLGMGHMEGQGAARDRAAAIAAFRKAISLDPKRDQDISPISSPARGALRDLGVTP